jgi:hypothetical protein
MAVNIFPKKKGRQYFELQKGGNDFKVSENSFPSGCSATEAQTLALHFLSKDENKKITRFLHFSPNHIK